MATRMRRRSAATGSRPGVSVIIRPPASTTVSSLTSIAKEEPDMSEHGFHVHGPHDHELEHATQHAAHGEGGSMVNQIALFTAVIATVGAIFSYMGGATQAEAMLDKNEAQIKTTEASDQWN